MAASNHISGGGCGAVHSVVPMVLAVMVAMVASGVEGQSRPPVFQYPDPLLEPVACGSPVGKPSLICDPAKHLSPYLYARLDEILLSIRGRGTCPCQNNCIWSYTLAVAIVPDITAIQGYTDVDTALKQFGWSLSQKWRHGTCEENGVTVYSVKHNKFQTVLGTQARTKLEDECREVIDERVRQHLKDKDLYQALTAMASEYREYFNGVKTCALPDKIDPTEGLYVALIFLCVIILFGLTYFFIVCFKRCIGKGKLRKANQNQAYASNSGTTFRIGGPTSHMTHSHPSQPGMRQQLPSARTAGLLSVGGYDGMGSIGLEV